MAKSRFKKVRKPETASLPTVAQDVDDLMRPEELDLMLQAGDGLFWQRQGNDLRLYSPEVVHIGVEAMWDLWERFNQLIEVRGNSDPGCV